MSTRPDTDQTSARAQTVGLRSLPRRQLVVTMTSVLLAMFLSSLDQSIAGTAMPRIVADLGGFSHYTWIATAYMITSTIALPITGKLTDMYGRKWFYTGGLIVFILGSLLSGLSQTMAQLILARGFQGIGAGVMMSNAFTVVADLYPPMERGKYTGLISSTFGLSSILGPILGGYITDALSWHWIFFINIPLGVLIILLFIFSFPDIRPHPARHQVDYLGATCLVAAVSPAMLALSWGGIDFPWLSPPVTGLFLVSAAMTFLFIRVEREAKEPILPLGLFRNRVVSVSVLVSFFSGIGMFGAITFIPLFFQGVLGMSATTSGSFLTPMTVGMVVGSGISGQVLSRAGGHYRLQGAAGLVVTAVGTALLAGMGTETGHPAAIAVTSLMGFGMGATMPLYIISIQNAVPYSIIGAATSFGAFFRSIGASVGLAAIGSILSNRFAAIFLDTLPAAVKAAVPQETLASLARNPQALVSVPAQAQLRAMFAPLGPEGAALFEQLLHTLREALSSALAETFLVSLAVVLFAFVANLFLKEIPLRTEHMTEED